MPYDPDAIEPCLQELHPYAELAALIRQDPEYAWTWHCVVSCAAMDEGVDHDIANQIASRAMYAMFGAQTQHPNYLTASTGSHDPLKLAQAHKRSLWEMLKER